MIFVYDGTIEGFFTAVFEAYRMGVEPVAIHSSKQDFQASLLYQTASIDTDLIKAERVITGIKRISYNALDNIYAAFRHRDADKDLAIFRFIKLLFCKKHEALNMLNHPDVIAFNNLVYAVNHEIHRMRGFVRFRQTDFGVYYAPISPDHDILDALAEHFTQRYKGMPFCIHDVGREKMLAYDGVICKIVPASQVQITLSEEEQALQAAWQDYFDSVNIRERQNLRLQRQFLPKRYRKFMPEFNSDLTFKKKANKIGE
ncbi:MAG TPA: TIGR03915 family putative DNA repair protein [Clostridia bacterium]